jgi:putative ABC transport system permease protein
MGRLTLLDMVRLASRGLRGHPLRFVLSVAGIAIGISAMVAILGVAQSSKAELNAVLSEFGTDLIEVRAGEDREGTYTRLPATAQTMLDNIGPVTAASSLAELDGMGAYRTPYVPAGRTSSVYVAAVDSSLAETLRAEVRAGRWFSVVDEEYPTVVLGAAAAERLGVTKVGTRLWVRDQWAVVVGILEPLPVALVVDAAVMLPDRAATTYFGHDGTSTSVYLRAGERSVESVVDVIGRTAHPQKPEAVKIARPSDALAAKLIADQTLNRLLIGVAAIGLLVGGIGVMNTMVIAVLERRSEIGLRRALGATRRNIAFQFLTESLLMSLTGGILGVLLGALATGVYASTQGWPVSLSPWVALAAIGITGVVGTAAGAYPAVRASRESPTSALASS